MKTPFSPVVRFWLAPIIFFLSVGAAPLAQPVTFPTADTAQILTDLGGFPCSEDSAFTCVTIDVPLDHFNTDDTRTIPVVFAVLPASGVRKGMFVVSTGGPGLSGVLSADYYSSGYDTSIFESFDIVFFDQRGIGLSGGLTCPFAATEYYQQDFRGLTPRQEQALKNTASTFVSDCVSELSNPELLPYVGTRQAVEDLEIFRQMVGDEKFWLYFYHTENDRFVLNIKTAGRWMCNLKYIRAGERLKITGQCNGRPIHMDDGVDRETQKMPDVPVTQEG